MLVEVLTQRDKSKGMHVQVVRDAALAIWLQAEVKRVKLQELTVVSSGEPPLPLF